MKELINVLKKPIDAIESKFGGSWKKILIFLGIIVGILIVTNLISTMYSFLVLSKEFTGKVDFSVLKEVDYVDVLLKNGLLRQLIIVGSMFAGIFVYGTVTKKEFNLINILTIIFVSLAASYLVQSCLNILFMFKFMYNTKFLMTIHNIIANAAEWYSIALLLFGLQKVYGLKASNKDVINLVIMFATMFAVRQFLFLAL